MLESFRWKALASLFLIYLSVFTGWYWPWGVLLAWWVILDLRTGETWLTEPVSRRTDPVVFWIVVASWIALTAFIIFAIAYWRIP